MKRKRVVSAICVVTALTMLMLGAIVLGVNPRSGKLFQVFIQEEVVSPLRLNLL